MARKRYPRRRVTGPVAERQVVLVRPGYPPADDADRPGRAPPLGADTGEIFAFSYHSLLPALAGKVLDVGATGLGMLTVVSGPGALLHSVVLALLG
jgi:hypothetical protein